MRAPNQEVAIAVMGATGSGKTSSSSSTSYPKLLPTEHKMRAPNQEVAIAVMGATGSGKTTFINLASGSRLRVGRGLQSCTGTIQVAQPFQLDGRSVTLIDTPGFDDTTRSDTDILKMIAQYLAVAYQNKHRLHGVIYIHRISDNRLGGVSRRNFKMFRELCGDTSLKNVIIATNMWGEVDLSVGEAREAELAREDMFFKPVLEKGAQLLRHENTLASAQALLRTILDNHPIPLRIQHELIDERKNIAQTAAGEELNREFIEQERKHREEMAVLKQEMQEAIQARDHETRKELEEEQRKLEKEMARVHQDSQKLASNYNEEKARLEERLQEVSQRSKQEADRAAAEHHRRIHDLETKLDAASNASAQEKEAMRREMNDLRSRVSAPKGGFFSNLGRAIDGLFGMA
ncbi:hypothetical protein PLICRDRAFT_178816 [Plicaturopsis crispa FD-325 SS-3]|uniref:G domain-containing protein n=1 Tax=Plicaturopsis crispa FD-325 SS-3 TaxID=944288 RepID=A0A0C9SL87_PLICR|nr:hypothetical protein PLICRDRAFT_178816 [Plicaturopsis crispa FD-325 SS-3]